MSGRSESSPQGHAGSQASQRSGPLVSGTRTQVPAIPWNPCLPSRGIHAHDAVETPPTITWNTHLDGRRRGCLDGRGDSFQVSEQILNLLRRHLDRQVAMENRVSHLHQAAEAVSDVIFDVPLLS